MPATVLDPSTALIVIDLQKGLVGYPTAHPMAEVVRRASALADAFRRHGRPVVLVNVDGDPPGRTEQTRPRPAPAADWTELVAELNPQPQDHRVTKRARGAFANTDLEAYLKGRGVTQLVVAGISTSAGVESTARQAFDLGFNVTVAVDAVTDMDLETHQGSITRIFPRLGETAAAQDIIDLADKTFA